MLFFGWDAFDELFEQVGPVRGEVFAFDAHAEPVASFCFFKQKTAYVMESRDWSSDVCSSD
eukprot:COSAG05_NODE_23458_length_258_cov_0.547170_1_plen_60_part_01